MWLEIGLGPRAENAEIVRLNNFPKNAMNHRKNHDQAWDTSANFAPGTGRGSRVIPCHPGEAQSCRASRSLEMA